MAYIKGEHTEPSCWKLEEERTLLRGGGSCNKTCMFRALVQNTVWNLKPAFHETEMMFSLVMQVCLLFFPHIWLAG